MNTPRPHKVNVGHYELDHAGTTWTIKALYYHGATHWQAFKPGDLLPAIERQRLRDIVEAIGFRS